MPIDIFHISKELLQSVYRHCMAVFNYIVCRKVRARYHLPIILKLLRLNGKGVEIGVANGNFSEAMLKYSNLSEVYSVDPWKEFPEGEYSDINAVTQEIADKRYLYVVDRLKKYKDRSKILRLTSQEASRFFAAETLDFIYIDSNHRYEKCKEDLELWWPKLKRKGIFAGHDYLDGILPQGNFGVKKAVDEFAGKYKKKIHIIDERWPTWFIIKT